MRLIRLILCFYILFGISNISFAANAGPSDTNICSMLNDVAKPERMFIELAKERMLNCSPKFNFSIPENSHEASNKSGWICNTNFYKSGLKKCQEVPVNAYSRYDSNDWFCNSNYYKNRGRTSCLSVPRNATKSTNDLGFNCNSGFKKSTSGQSCISNPTPTTTNDTPKKSIPNNARKVSNETIDDEWMTSGWVCNKNYYRSNDKTGCLLAPENRFSPANSNILWMCTAGNKINSTRTECITDDTQTTTPNPTPQPTVTSSNQNDDDNALIVIIVIVVIIIVAWLMLKPSSPAPIPSKSRNTQGSQPRSTPSPQPRSTSGSKYKPPIKPKPKPVPKAQPKSKTTNINNPNLLLIEIGVAVAFIDGNLSDEEEVILKEWMTKTLKYDNNISSSKQLFNETFSDAIKAAKAGNLDIQDICRLLNKKGTKELNKEAFRFAYEIMGADGEIHKNEVKMIKLLEKNLQILSEDVTRIRDQFLIKTMIKKDFKIVNLLGLDVSASSQTICRELTKEFSKWNAIINQVKTKRERDNIQKLLDLLGEAREENDC